MKAVSLRLPNIIPFLLFFFAGVSQAQAQAAFDPAQFFDQRCSSCHSVGGGDEIGPDLKGVTERRSEEWLVKMIQSPQDLIQSGDPVAVELFNRYKKKKMPDTDLSAGEIRELLAFIEGGGPSEKSLDVKPASEATPQQIAFGRDLFLGTRSLQNSGPSCISCHSAGSAGPLGGGSLALDLTQVYSRYEDKGLAKALAKPGFPVMQEIYSKKPLTAEEAYALKAFLYQTDQKELPSAGFQKKFIFLGLAGVVLFLGFFDLSWRKRRKVSTKPVHGGEH